MSSSIYKFVFQNIQMGWEDYDWRKVRAGAGRCRLWRCQVGMARVGAEPFPEQGCWPIQSPVSALGGRRGEALHCPWGEGEAGHVGLAWVEPHAGTEAEGRDPLNLKNTQLWAESLLRSG